MPDVKLRLYIEFDSRREQLRRLFPITAAKSCAQVHKFALRGGLLII